MPLVQGSSRQAISENIRREMGAHKPQKQAIAIALDVARRNRAGGGRAVQPIQRAGLIASTVPGRTDKHSINVLSGSYILPADHVAHLGQDNSMAGGRVLDSMFETNSARRRNLPVTGDIVPIVVAGGEYLLEPDQVEKVGDGDLTKGHNSLDMWVKSGRKKHITLLKSLPPPKTK